VTSTDLAYQIQGRTLTLPIHVRDADSWAAQFFVPAAAAQRIVDPTGLEVAQPIPGRAVVNLAFVRYKDTDLDSYNELAIAFLVRRDDATKGSALDKMREFVQGRIGVYIHQLPVTQTFTLEAGQTIWGYPKFLADIDIIEEDGRVVCSLAHDGTYVLTLELREGGPIKLPQQNLATYSLRDDVLRRTEWEQDAPMRARLGGATLELGSHPIADELRTLGLPKRALMCSTMRGMRATFGPAVPV
jgi:hypothetical protein